MLTPTEKLQLQKQKLKTLMLSMLEMLPPTIQMMASCYLGMIETMIDNLTEEQIDNVILEAKKFVHALECNE